MAPSSSSSSSANRGVPSTTATTATVCPGTKLVSASTSGRWPTICRQQMRGTGSSLSTSVWSDKGGMRRGLYTGLQGEKNSVRRAGSTLKTLTHPSGNYRRNSCADKTNGSMDKGLLSRRSPLPQTSSLPLTTSVMPGSSSSSSSSSRVGWFYLTLLVALASSSTHQAAAQFTTGKCTFVRNLYLINIVLFQFIRMQAHTCTQICRIFQMESIALY